MHSHIFQINTEPLKREDYINEEEFYEGYSHLMDYCSNISKEEEDEVLDVLPMILEGLCEVNGRELTVLDVTKFREDWKADLIEKAKSLEMVFSSTTMYRLKSACEVTHKDISSLFYTPEWSGTAQHLGDFVMYLQCLKPGAKLYVGGILDYHW